MMRALHPDGKPNEPKHKRLNRVYIKRAFERLNEAIKSDGGTTRASCIVPFKVKKAAAAGSDYVPPVEEEEEAPVLA